MSQTNVDALRGVYERWARGDFWTPEIFDPQVQTIFSADLPDVDVGVGLDGLEANLKNYLSAWKDVRMAAEDFRDVGDSVVVIFRWSGTGRTTGIHFGEQRAHIWTFRNAKAIRLEGYISVSAALGAMGLAE